MSVAKANTHAWYEDSTWVLWCFSEELEYDEVLWVDTHVEVFPVSDIVDQPVNAGSRQIMQVESSAWRYVETCASVTLILLEYKLHYDKLLN